MNRMQVIDIYQSVTGADNLSECQVSVTVENGALIRNYNDLTELIKKFEPDQGWLCYPSEVLILNAGDLSDNDERILYGELVKGSESMHLQQVEDGWCVVRLKEGEGEKCLKKIQNFCVSKSQTIQYCIYWKYSERGYEPDSYRFDGFKNSNGKA